MSKKLDAASRIGQLANILQISHKKAEEEAVASDTPPAPPVTSSVPAVQATRARHEPRDSAPARKAAQDGVEQAVPPSPAPARGRSGKSSDKANYKFKGLYLRKDTQKAVKRRLEDLETGQDFSMLVEALLVRWIEETS